MNDRSRGTPPDTPPDAMDRWLRETLDSERGAAPSDCLDPETLAAWAEGGLSGSERSFAEAHAARCARCQSMLAVMARTVPPAPASAPSSFRKWIMMLTPAAAGAVAVALWFLVEPRRPIVQPVPERAATVASDDRAGADRDRSAPTAASAPAPTGAAAAAPGPADKAAAPSETFRTLQDQKEERSTRKVAAVPPQAPLSKADEIKSVEGRREREKDATPKPLAETVTVESKSQTVAGQQQNAQSELPRDYQRSAQLQAPPPAPQQTQQQTTQTGAVAGPLPRAAPPPPPAAPKPAPARVDGFLDASARAAGGGAGRGGNPAANEALQVREMPPLTAVAPDGSARWRVAQRTVQQSVDGGATWSAQFTLDEGVLLLSGTASSSSVCWFVGRSGAIVATSDGRTWRRIAFPERIDLVSVTAADARTATVVSSDKRVFVTTDGGARWTAK
ncbi:MAG TPA: YCF48-related protein [Vicinamibacterales bacterium]|jgi:hypothetical protein